MKNQLGTVKNSNLIQRSLTVDNKLRRAPKYQELSFNISLMCTGR